MSGKAERRSSSPGLTQKTALRKDFPGLLDGRDQPGYVLNCVPPSLGSNPNASECDCIWR